MYELADYSIPTVGDLCEGRVGICGESSIKLTVKTHLTSENG